MCELKNLVNVMFVDSGIICYCFDCDWVSSVECKGVFQQGINEKLVGKFDYFIIRYFYIQGLIFFFNSQSLRLSFLFYILQLVKNRLNFFFEFLYV